MNEYSRKIEMSHDLKHEETWYRKGKPKREAKQMKNDPNDPNDGISLSDEESKQAEGLNRDQNLMKIDPIPPDHTTHSKGEYIIGIYGLMKELIGKVLLWSVR